MQHSHFRNVVRLTQRKPSAEELRARWMAERNNLWAMRLTCPLVVAIMAGFGWLSTDELPAFLFYAGAVILASAGIVLDGVTRQDVRIARAAWLHCRIGLDQ